MEVEIEHVFSEYGSKLADGLREAVTKGVTEGFGSDDVLESLTADPLEAGSKLIKWILEVLLAPVLEKIVDPAQTVTAGDIKSFATGLTSSYSDVFEKEYLTDKHKEALDKIGQGTDVPIFDPEAVKKKNQEVLKALNEGDECSVLVGPSPILPGRVALIVDRNKHRDEDCNYVMSLQYSQFGSVKMVAKASTFSNGVLEFTGVPEDLVKQYFSWADITKKKLKFAN
jgi:hypothetical protein